MAKRSITKRWIFNNLGIVLLILLVVETCFILVIQNYYYVSVRQYMTAKLNSVTSVLTRYSADSTKNFSAEVRNTVETFSDKDKMELMIIDSKGRVVLTSSGFSPDSSIKMPDYENSSGYWVGKQASGEKIMAITYSISSLSNEYDAVRVVTSMTEIDSHIVSMILAVTLICVVILALLAFMGIYFVGSIVKPVQQINHIAGRLAMGDFAVRIDCKSEDEIGELCTAINHMANELSNSEAMKNEFISSVSHELRTPLTAIKGWAETLNSDVDHETMEKGMRVIINETERLSQMVEELLDFSRMQNGRFQLHMATMDILAELEDAVLIYGEKAKKENIELVYNAPEMLPFVFGDKNRLRQVFINIIDNAIKYSDGGTVTVEAFQEDDCIQIVVADEGVGISAEDLPKVKKKFYKANHTRRGSGIGLGVADEIVSMHNGVLDILSEEGKGTTVVIRLPIEKQNKSAENPETP